jgi:DnaJ-class molecular chaperone
MAETTYAKKRRSICPDCRGNGYIKTPHEVYADQFDVRQCESCSSEGEIDGKV